MTHLFASSLLTSGTALFLAVLVFFKNPTNRLYRVFSFYCLSIAAWSFFFLLSTMSGTGEEALGYVRALHFSALFIPVMFVHFVDILLRENARPADRIAVRSAYAITLVFIPLCFTPWIAAAVEPRFGLRYYTRPDALYGFYVGFWLLAASYGLTRLIAEYFRANPIRRTLLQYFFVASVCGFLGAVDNFLRVYDIVVLPSYAYGNYLIAVFMLVTAYMILTRRLLDVRVIVKRAAVFAGIFLFVYAAFATIIIRGFDFFKNLLGWSSLNSALPAALIITLSIHPLERFLSRVTDRFLFQNKYDYRRLLRLFTAEVLTVLDLQSLADKTIEGFVRIIRLEYAAFFLLDETDGSYRLIAGAAGPAKHGVSIPASDESVHRLRELKEPALHDRKSAPGVHVPIHFRDKLIGFLELGPKKSGEGYNQEDLDVLAAVSGTLAVAVSNARLFEALAATQAEAAQNEKMAVIGTLSAGIHHEICNPLGIARGQCELFLMNLKDGFFRSRKSEEMDSIFAALAQKIIDEIDRATEITKRLSEFSKPSAKGEAQNVSVRKELQEVLALLSHELKMRDFLFKNSLPEDFPEIRVNRRQFQQVLFNLIRNAIQARDEKPGRVELTGAVAGNRAVLRLTDNGTGIPADKMNRIFSAFYSTKVAEAGTGLGLFIVKQIVEKYDGTLTVESREGMGATFTLIFPVA